MSVVIKSRTYTNPFTDSTETVFPDWLIGNVGDWIRAKFVVEAKVDYRASVTEPIQLDLEQKILKLMNGKKWSDYGFDINTNVTLTLKKKTSSDGINYTTQNLSYTLTIVNIASGNLSYSGGNSMENDLETDSLPADRGNVKYSNVYISSNINLEGLRLKYANVPNSDIQSHSLYSLIDGTETEAFLNNLNTLNTSYQNMTLIGNQSGNAIHSIRIKKKGISSIPIGVGRIVQGPNDFILRNGVRSISLNVPIDATGLSGVNTVYQGSFYNGEANQKNILIPAVENGVISISPTLRLNFNEAGNANNSTVSLVLRKYTGTDRLVLSGVNVIETAQVSPKELNQIIFSKQVDIVTSNEHSYVLSIDITTNDDTVSNPQSYSLDMSGNMNFETTQSQRRIIDFFDQNTYEIEILYMLTPMFENITDITDIQMPSFLESSGSLSDTIEINFYPKWNNPNTKVSNNLSLTERLGNTGWFNENYNGLPNNFQVSHVSYKDQLSNSIPKVDYNGETTVKIGVSGVPNLINNKTAVSFGFSLLPDNENVYKVNQYGNHKNLRVNSPLDKVFMLGTTTSTTFDGFSPDNAKIASKNISVYKVDNELFLEFTLVPNQSFRDFVENNGKGYFIWISVENSAPVTNMSDRVTLLADSGEMILNEQIDGSLEGVVASFVEHPYNENNQGVQVYSGFIEDDILSRLNFSLPTGTKLNSVNVGFEIANVSTGLNFELERISANLSQYVFLNGVSEVDYSSTRGFKMSDDNIKNTVQVKRLPDLDLPDMKAFQVFYGAKIRWEDWIVKNGVPVEFFNSDYNNNGFNNNWFGYQLNSNYKLRLFVVFNIDDSSGNKILKNSFPISIKSYNSNEFLTTEHQYINSQTNELLPSEIDANTGLVTGTILSTVPTKIRIKYKPISGNIIYDLTELYAVTTIEVKNGQGLMSHRQLSSVISSELDNPLKPLENEDKLKIYIENNEIITECLILPQLLDNGSSFKITGRLGCFNASTPATEQTYEVINYENQYE